MTSFRTEAIERTRDERISAARGLVKLRTRRGLQPSGRLLRIAQERMSFESSTGFRQPPTG